MKDRPEAVYKFNRGSNGRGRDQTAPPLSTDCHLMYE